jgi:dTMP kinase
MLEPTLTTDLTLLFDVPLSLAMERLNRGRELDRIELESQEFFARVQNTYYQLEAEEPERIKRIMTNQPLQVTRNDILAQLDKLLLRM